MTTQANSVLQKKSILEKILGPTITAKKSSPHAGISPAEIRSSVQRGFPFSSFERLQTEIDVPQKELSELLGIPTRTIARRKEEKRLTPVESDRLYRLSRVLAFTVEVLGSSEKARTWLKKPNRSLGGEIPLSLLDTDIGAQQVTDVLMRLRYGIY